MQNLLRSHAKKAGLAPGTPVFVGKKMVAGLTVNLMNYGDSMIQERQIEDVGEIQLCREKNKISWVDVIGLHEEEKIQEIGKCFALHPLTVEDILNTAQRPKVEFFESYIFIVVRMTTYDQENATVESEQVSLILGEDYLVTFQERPGDTFEAIRGRIRANKGKIRRSGVDYLAYTLIDSIVDHYFNVLESVGEEIDDIEDNLLIAPDNEILQRIHFLKKEMLLLRRSIWPLRDILGGLEREENTFIRPSTEVYMRDLYDHTIQVIDTVETFRDLIAGMLDLYLSTVSNRMNEVMKVLTIYAAIFIPLSFIAGLYGMNFNSEKSPFNMPELNWFYGYPFALALMAGVAMALLLFFRKKKWL